jgi:hypothetical protein
MEADAADRERLQTSMDAAIKAQDFTLAAELRDKLQFAKDSDAIYRTSEMLAAAVAEERYADAAKVGLSGAFTKRWQPVWSSL